MEFELRPDSDGGYRMFPKEDTGCGCGTIIVIFIIVIIVGMCSDGGHKSNRNSNQSRQSDNNQMSIIEENIEDSANTPSVSDINLDDYFDTDETTNEDPSNSIANDNENQQQEVIIDDVNHHEADSPRNDIDNESSHDSDNMQHEPKVIEDDVNQYNTNSNQTAKQPVTNEGKIKDTPMFKIDDIVYIKQVGKYKVIQLKDGRMVRYDTTTGKNTIIQRVDRKKTTKTYFEDEIYSDQ